MHTYTSVNRERLNVAVTVPLKNLTRFTSGHCTLWPKKKKLSSLQWWMPELLPQTMIQTEFQRAPWEEDEWATDIHLIDCIQGFENTRSVMTLQCSLSSVWMIYLASICLHKADGACTSQHEYITRFQQFIQRTQRDLKYYPIRHNMFLLTGESFADFIWEVSACFMISLV